MEGHGWKPVHTANNVRIVEDEGSSFRGAEVRGARGSLESDKGAPQGRQPHSRLACPLVLQQRALSFVRGDSSRELPDLDRVSGRIHQKLQECPRTTMPDQAGQPGGLSGNCVLGLRGGPPRFSPQSVQHTHTHALRQQKFSGHGSHRVNKRGGWDEEDGAWTHGPCGCLQLRFRTNIQGFCS